MATISDSERALSQAAKDFLTTGSPLLPIEAVAWENRKTDAPKKKTWAAFFYRPANPTARTIGRQGIDEMVGFIQIDISVTIDSGTSVHKLWQDKARTFFAPGNSFGDVHITETGMGQGRIDGNHFKRSITIFFSSNHKRLNA